MTRTCANCLSADFGGNRYGHTGYRDGRNVQHGVCTQTDRGITQATPWCGTAIPIDQPGVRMQPRQLELTMEET